MKAGDIYSMAGDGKAGYSGNGGPATSAKVRPQFLAVDAAGNLLIGATGYHRVQRVTG